MPYNSQTGIITAPDGIHDVQQALGVSYRDLGRLITSGRVNMWAKHKPVWHFGAGAPIATACPAEYSNNETNPSNMPDGNPNHVDGDYGVACMEVFQGTSIQAQDNYTDIISADWTYAHPRGAGYTDVYGKPASWFRLTDFDGYNHRATPPTYLALPVINVNTFEMSQTATVLINVVEANDDPTVIGIETLDNELLDLRNARFFVLVLNRTAPANNGIFIGDTNIMHQDGTVEGQYSVDINLQAAGRAGYGKLFNSVGDYPFYCGFRVLPPAENYKWLMIPGNDLYPNHGIIHVYSDAAGVGLGIIDAYVAPNVSPTSLSAFRPYSDISDEQEGDYAMYSATGTFMLAILFHNSGTVSRNYSTSDFVLRDPASQSSYIAPSGVWNQMQPTQLYVGSDHDTPGGYDVGSSAETSYTIGAGKYKWVCLRWEGVFSTSAYRTASGPNNNQELLFMAGVNSLLSDALFVFYQSGEGFVQR